MDEVSCHRDGGVLRIELNRPSRLNALTAPVVQALLAVAGEATAAYGDTRVLVLAGAPPAFCAGADRSALAFLTAPATTDAERLGELRAAGELILALQRFPGPTIAEVGGAAVGGGCNLALACDLVYASDDARFGEVFVRHGLALDMGGSWLLPRLAGPRQAAELAFSGAIIGAAEALSLGLVSAVVPADSLRAVVAALAAELARHPAQALAAIKSQLRHGLTHDLAASLEYEAQQQNARLRDLPPLSAP
jgi:2-(1,2-epoxy-1,2-dihydrophenyl)acetyl-CoA isomerase